jgi:hypothetical protein
MSKIKYCTWKTADFLRTGCMVWRWEEGSPILLAEDLNSVEIAWFDGVGWRKSSRDFLPFKNYKLKFKVKAIAA